jgi:hypothetical protein
MSVRDNIDPNKQKRNYTLLYELDKHSSYTAYNEEITLNDNPNNYKYIVCVTSCWYYTKEEVMQTDVQIIPTCLLTDQHIPFRVLSIYNIKGNSECYTNVNIEINTTNTARIVNQNKYFYIGYKIYGTNVL